ncbi:hypothetical protein [Pseudoalteromonas viridis]|uniref:Carboxypeptidase regulatory-like domain-containing protein n=1 Tax=Pseudoalteromonas viridis TaxID=339617 RepID=A0ABX7VB16_9GAMM|nr:hypothetical protein [Pseudoalteromonas viridis]QTL38128.1 hypothetical protein J5X90_20515 [Pseudoalteromonas viridis]
MFKYSKVALGIATCFALTGCLEVEDNDDSKKLAEQVEQQNSIIQEQLDLAKQQHEITQAPITLTGKVVSVSEGVSASDATISVLLNGQWRESGSVDEQGQFSVAKLPAGHELLIKVASASDAFVTRYFAVSTPYSSITREESFDLLDLEVSAGYTKEFTVQESGTGEGLKTLSIWAADIVADDTMVGSTRTREAYLERMTKEYSQKAVFNEEKGVYQITLAKDLPSSLHYQADINADKIADYRPEFAPFNFDADTMTLVSADNVTDTDNFYLEPVKQQTYKLALTVLNSEGNVIEVDRIVAQGNDMGAKFATLNAETMQYELDAKYFGQLTLQIPSFIKGDVVFNGSTVNIQSYDEQNGSYGVEINGNYNRVDLVDNTLNLVVKVSDTLVEETTVSVLNTKNMHTAKDHAAIYFNVPVAVVADSVELEKVQDITVSSVNGLTTIVAQPVTIAASTSTDLNNTRLKVTPDAPLEVGSLYSVKVNKLQNLASGETESINYSTVNTVVQADTDFSLDSIIADNDNYRKNDELILAKNSGGQDSWDHSGSSNVSLYLPFNFTNVEKLSIQVTGYTSNGEQIDYNNGAITLVDQGDIRFSYDTRLVHTYQLANNEQIDNPNGYFGTMEHGTTLENGRYMRLATGIYLADNTDQSANAITFTYKLQLKGDKTIKSGTMALPVQ